MKRRWPRNPDAFDKAMGVYNMIFMIAFVGSRS